MYPHPKYRENEALLYSLLWTGLVAQLTDLAGSSILSNPVRIRSSNALFFVMELEIKILNLTVVFINKSIYIHRIYYLNQYL